MTRILLAVAVCLAWISSSAQAPPPQTVTHQDQPTTVHSTAVSPDLSGMFTFLREGEFVQLTVEDGQLSGFVSRFGDTESDKGQFIDQFFDKATLAGDHLYFKKIG